jgi:hypothetical protein
MLGVQSTQVVLSRATNLTEGYMFHRVITSKAVRVGAGLAPFAAALAFVAESSAHISDARLKKAIRHI